MRKLICLLLACLCLQAYAQEREGAAPKWANKAQKSIVSVVTYDQNQNMLASGSGVVIDNQGTVLGGLQPLPRGIQRRGGGHGRTESDVDRILGANDTYDIVKMTTKAGKTSPLTLASSTAAQVGSTVYALAYSKNKVATCPSAAIEKKDLVEGVGDNAAKHYPYYTLSKAIDTNYNGAALLNERGELIGLLLSPVGGKSNAIDANFGNDLVISTIQSKLSAMTLNNIHIKKDVPPTAEEALVYLYFNSRTASNDVYLDMVNRFVEKFPRNAEGYYRRATPLLDLHRFDEANSDLNTYLNLASDKMMAHSNVAQTIYTKLLYQPEPKYDKWNYDLALDHCDKAIALAQAQENAAKTDSAKQGAAMQTTEYQLQKAQILMAKGDDQAAIRLYDDVNAGPFRSAATLYAASMAHEAAGDSLSTQIELMDQAIAIFGTPLPKDAGNYVMRRAQLLKKAGRTREAVVDYNTYAALNEGELSATFFYDRAMLEQDARMYQPALADLDSAIAQAPTTPLLYVEKSALLLRVNMLDECIEAAQQAINLTDKMPDAYRILGYAQLEKGNKADALRNLQKAVELGDDTAQQLIDKYLK